MISAWEIYWILQLDTFNLAAIFVGLFLFCLAVIFYIYGETTLDEGQKENSDEKIKEGKTHCKLGTLTGFLGCVLVLFSVFLPSTQTAATMWLAPKIINNKQIQEEASELYGLAKKALKEAVDE